MEQEHNNCNTSLIHRNYETLLGRHFVVMGWIPGQDPVLLSGRHLLVHCSPRAPFKPPNFLLCLLFSVASQNGYSEYGLLKACTHFLGVLPTSISLGAQVLFFKDQVVKAFFGNEIPSEET